MMLSEVNLQFSHLSSKNVKSWYQIWRRFILIINTNQATKIMYDTYLLFFIFFEDLWESIYFLHKIQYEQCYHYITHYFTVKTNVVLQKYVLLSINVEKDWPKLVVNTDILINSLIGQFSNYHSLMCRKRKILLQICNVYLYVI